MASVFLSYDSDDLPKARSIALALEKAGHSVWWDRHIKSGAQYSKEIEEALNRADAVVVLWSERSVDSAWVRDEAAAGRDTGRLVPVSIGEAAPPLGFRQYQTTDLSRWKGRARAPAFQEMLGAIAALGLQSGAVPVAIVAPRNLPRVPPSILIAVTFFILAGAALLIWRPWSGPVTQVVAVAAASPSSEAGDLARDLLAKLGNLQGTQTNALQLVQGGRDGDADFTFEVGGAKQGSVTTANLVFLAGKERALLWSRNFEQPSVKQADLKQQLAFTAAKVLECAVEALTSEAGLLRQETLKLYLNGCSSFSEVASYDPRPLIPAFRAVVEQAPRFEGAWAKLLHAEAEVTTGGDWGEDAEGMKQQLLRHMAEARKLNPNMAELLLAEAELAPANAFARRMALIERAVERNPENANAQIAYAMYLGKVGRGFDAVDRAKRAAQLDPLSPLTRDAVISALTYNNELDAALEELRRAEQLWPGASNLLGARYRIHLRYGDPNEALRIHRLSDFGGPHRDAFLQARINPTPANIERAISYPRRWMQVTPRAIGELAQVLGAFEREEELFPMLLNWQHPENVDSIIDVLFRPALANFRRDPRMIAVAKRIGLLEYWQQSGKWPDFCRDPDLPYDCEAAAAKLAG